MAEPQTPPRLVRATAVGFYDGHLIRQGMTFSLTDPAHFTKSWMVWAEPAAGDDLATLRNASPKIRSSAGVELKQKTTKPRGTLRGEGPEDGI